MVLIEVSRVFVHLGHQKACLYLVQERDQLLQLSDLRLSCPGPPACSPQLKQMLMTQACRRPGLPLLEPNHYHPLSLVSSQTTTQPPHHIN
jgi:hypothetical protein